jgi:hydroxymethylpyrimidine pyrophosphatase-like HAD family hydrolase
VTAVIAIDLDRTLIYSTAALGLTMPDALAPPLMVAEVYQGRPLSFMTDRAARELRALAQAAVVVPTTTRSRVQFERVRLPGVRSVYAVTSNGAKLLINGVPDQDWAVNVRSALAGSAPLETVKHYLDRHAVGPWVLKRRSAEHVFCYLVVDRAEVPGGFLQDLAGWAAQQGWRTSVQGRKVYCVPDRLTKSAAVAEIVRRVGTGGYLAAGDSLLDAELLDEASAGVRPGHGELAEIGWTRPHIEVTVATGVLAGEEVVLRLADLAAVTPPADSVAAPVDLSLVRSSEQIPGSNSGPLR